MQSRNGKRVMLSLVAILFMIGMVPFAGACTEGDTQSLQGILENIDTVNGQITVVTKDGQTRVVTIDSKTEVTIDGQTVAIEALDPGTNIEIELEDDSPDTAGAVKARSEKTEGTGGSGNGEGVSEGEGETGRDEDKAGEGEKQEEDLEDEDEVEKESEEEQDPETAPAIPHTLQGRENCLTCHGQNGIEPFPADHAGRTNDVCTTCHQPSLS